MKKALLSFAFIAFVSVLHAQVSQSDALDLVQTKARKFGLDVVNYKISNLGNTNKKEYWFMAVGSDGGACLMSVTETSLKINFTKCVSFYEVTSLSEFYGEIPAYFDVEEEKRQQEAERKKQIAEEKRIAEEARQRKLRSDSELPVVLKKLDDLLVLKDTLTILSELEALNNSDLINGNESELNSQKLQKYYGIKNEFNENLRLKNLRIEKEKERLRLENERVEKEKEKERVRIENERIENERILSYKTNTIVIKNLEVASHDFPKLMTYNEAVAACAELGDGWRLPTIRELNKMRKKTKKLVGFSSSNYWSSTEPIVYGRGFGKKIDTTQAASQTLIGRKRTDRDYKNCEMLEKSAGLQVRAVRTI
jgi:hypothetical protein